MVARVITNGNMADKLKTYFFLVGLQWVVKGAIDVDIGANPSAEGGEDEGVDDQAVRIVDIVDIIAGATCFRQEAVSCLHEEVYQVVDTQTR